MQIATFSNGGFVLHKVYIGSAMKYSAWFDKDRNLLDAEGIDSARRSRNVKKGGPVWQRLQSIGRSVKVPEGSQPTQEV